MTAPTEAQKAKARELYVTCTDCDGSGGVDHDCRLCQGRGSWFPSIAWVAQTLADEAERAVKAENDRCWKLLVNYVQAWKQAAATEGGTIAAQVRVMENHRDAIRSRGTP